MNENLNGNTNQNVEMGTNNNVQQPTNTVPTGGTSLEDKAKNFTNKLMDTPESQEKFDQNTIDAGKGMGILCYILPFIPYFAEKNNRYVQYHAKQGMNLLVVGIAYGIFSAIISSLIKVKDCGEYDAYIDAFGLSSYCPKVTPWWVNWPLWIIGGCISIIAVIGIINVVNGKAKELPIVNKIKIFK